MNWRKYERHPKSAEYQDIKGQAWEEFLASMTESSIKRRPIIIFEGKILDGWQRQLACVAKDVEPPYEELPEGEHPEEFVRIANDHRRHESAETHCQRREQRRAKVVELRAQGQSIRAIADYLGISVTTAQRDCEASGVPGGTPEPEQGTPSGQGADSPPPPPPKITGKDGKQYPPKKEKKLCPHCQTLVRKSLALPARCEECSELNRTKRAGQTTRPLRGPHKPGQTLRNYKKEFDTHYGAIVRLFDDMRRELGCAEVGPFLGALRLETGLLENFKEANKLVASKRK